MSIDCQKIPVSEKNIVRACSFTIKKVSVFILSIVLLSVLIFSFSAGKAETYNEVFAGNKYYEYMQDIYKNHNSHYCQKLRILSITSYFRERNSSLSKKLAKTYATLVERYSRINNADPFLSAAVLVRESNVRRKANNSNIAYGFMQINWRANGEWIKRKFPKINRPKDLYRTVNNLKVGTYILGQDLKMSEGNTDKALDKYRGKSLISYRIDVLNHYEEVTRRFKKLKNGDLGYTLTDIYHRIF